MRHRIRTHKRGLSNQCGGTLVELMMSIFVMVVAASSILSGFLTADYLTKNATETSLALEDLEDLMERIQSTPFNNLQADFQDGVADGGLANDYAAIVGGYALPGQQITVSYASLTADRIEVVATLSWTQRERARTISLSSVRTSSS